MLRKRIDQYFSTEGSHESVIIDIPRGNYAPVFRSRIVAASNGAAVSVQAAAVQDDQPSESSAESRTSVAATPATESFVRRRTPWLTLALVLIVACTAVGGYLHSRTLNAGATALPSDVREFWSQIFRPDASTSIVLDDAALSLYQQVTGRRVELSDYFDRSYVRTVSQGPSALDREFLNSMILRRQSSYEDVSLLAGLDQMANMLHSSANTRFARDFSFREIKAGDVILLGNSFSNPWIQLFEKHLTLQWKFDPASAAYYPVDTTVADQEKYHGEAAAGRPHESYATVSFLPNLSGSGNVLIISGTGGTATAAALAFLSDPHSLAQLRERLPRNGGGPRYFDLLLRVESRNTLPRGTEVLLVRPPQP